MPYHEVQWQKTVLERWLVSFKVGNTPSLGTEMSPLPDRPLTIDRWVRRNLEPCRSSIPGFGKDNVFALAVLLNRWAQDGSSNVPGGGKKERIS